MPFITTGNRAAAAIVPPNLIASRTTEPGAPATGSKYIVPAGTTGAWSGHANEIATWSGTVWSYQTPVEGWLVYIDDENQYCFYNGMAWVVNMAAAHAASHEDGGADELIVENLLTAGVLGSQSTSAGDGTLYMGI